MSPEQKLDVMHALIRQAWELKAAAVRARQPEQSGSDRHLRGVAMMLRISGDTVDSGSLLQWAEHLDLLETLKQARRFSPD